MKVSWDDYSQLNGKKMFQTTNQNIYFWVNHGRHGHAGHGHSGEDLFLDRSG